MVSQKPVVVFIHRGFAMVLVNSWTCAGSDSLLWPASNCGIARGRKETSGCACLGLSSRARSGTLCTAGHFKGVCFGTPGGGGLDGLYIKSTFTWEKAWNPPNHLGPRCVTAHAHVVLPEELVHGLHLQMGVYEAGARIVGLELWGCVKSQERASQKNSETHRNSSSLCSSLRQHLHQKEVKEGQENRINKGNIFVLRSKIFRAGKQRSSPSRPRIRERARKRD